MYFREIFHQSRHTLSYAALAAARRLSHQPARSKPAGCRCLQAQFRCPHFSCRTSQAKNLQVAGARRCPLAIKPVCCHAQTKADANSNLPSLQVMILKQQHPNQSSSDTRVRQICTPPNQIEFNSHKDRLCCRYHGETTRSPTSCMPAALSPSSSPRHRCVLAFVEHPSHGELGFLTEEPWEAKNTFKEVGAEQGRGGSNPISAGLEGVLQGVQQSHRKRSPCADSGDGEETERVRGVACAAVQVLCRLVWALQVNVGFAGLPA